MTAADALLALLSLGVAALLAKGSRLPVAVLLVASAMAISAMLFLPTERLSSWFGIDRVNRLYGLARMTPLDPPEWIHLGAFAWLGFLVWLARDDLRNWRGITIVAGLGVAAELSQWLTDGRQIHIGDAALNVLGGLAGVLLAWPWCMRKRQRGGSRHEDVR